MAAYVDAGTVPSKPARKTFERRAEASVVSSAEELGYEGAACLFRSILTPAVLSISLFLGLVEQVSQDEAGEGRFRSV